MLLSEARPRPYRPSEHDRQRNKYIDQLAAETPSKDLGIDALRKRAEWHNKYGKDIVASIDRSVWSTEQEAKDRHQKNPRYSVNMHACNKIIHHFIEYYNGFSWKDYHYSTKRTLGGDVNVILTSSYHDSFNVEFSVERSFIVNKPVEIDQRVDNEWRVSSKLLDDGRTEITIELGSYNRYQDSDMLHALLENPEAKAAYDYLYKMYTSTDEYDYVGKTNDGEEYDAYTEGLDELGYKGNDDARAKFAVMERALNEIIKPTVDKIEQKYKALKLHVSQHLGEYTK